MQFADMTFGVEIECYSPRPKEQLFAAMATTGLRMSQPARSIHTATPGWKVVPDASLHQATMPGMYGVEVVSPILKGEAGIEQMTKAADAVKAFGSRVNKSCGFHVHIGAANATVAQLRNLAKLFLKYESHFDTICPESRRENRFARSNRAIASGKIDVYGNVRRDCRAHDYASQIALAFQKLDNARSVQQLADVMNGGYATGGARDHYTEYRYFKLNFQSLASHGTVEFRQQAGTVESTKMAAWVRLVVGLVATAFTVKTVSSQEEPSFEQLLRKVDRATAAYIKTRRTALNRGVTFADEE